MRRHAGLAVLLVLACLPSGYAQGRVVVLGVDGMDHGLTREFLDAGNLPELAAVAAAGSFAPLLPANPAQSPTSWASVVTGLNPGAHGILGFVRRAIREGEVVPELGLVAVEHRPVLTTGIRGLGFLGATLVALIPWILLRRRRRRIGILVSVALLAFLLLFLRWLYGQIPESMPAPVNLRRGAALWEALDRDGIQAISLQAPCAFPAPPLEHGHLLCGLGVPDLLGTPGTVSVFRDEPVPDGRRTTAMGGRDVPLRREKDGRLAGASLLGPRHPVKREPMTIPLDLADEASGLRLRFQDQDLGLEAGRFTEHLPVTFRPGEILPPIQGLVRFRLQRGAPHPVLYQEPLQIDPRAQFPWAAITSPLQYGKELAAAGLFETVGWATATNPYQDELIDDATFEEDVAGLDARQHAMILEQLARKDWRVFFAVLPTPDRVQHVFWRDRDPGHPAHDPAGAARRGDLILESYRKVDALVGRIRREVLAAGDVLLVVSDHGFAPFRKAVNLNRWLAREGYLSARPDGARSLEANLGQPVSNVEWAKTRAYSLGLGRIWLNVRGREPGGIVAPGDADALAREIAGKLLALEDGGARVVRSTRLAKELYRGERVLDAAEITVGFERGYRISWSSCLLGLDEPMIFDNRTRWSGDHCSVDPALVPGVVFATVRLAADGAEVTDVYPTVRALLALPPATGLDGKSLWTP